MIEIDLREKWDKERLKEKDNDLKRKDQLLAEALEQLLACEWSVSLSTIVDIQKELGITED